MKLILPLVILFLLAGCATAPVKRGTTDTADDGKSGGKKLKFSDSTVTAVPDSFLTDITKNDNREIVIPVKPEKKPVEVVVKYDTLQAFAVQLQALGNEQAAADLVARLQREEKDSVFFNREGSLFKVRIGPYFVRNQADSKKNEYKTKGFRGAWVTPYLYIRKSEGSKQPAEAVVENRKKNTNPAPAEEGNIYIQIASASSLDNARNFILGNPSFGDKNILIKEFRGAYKLVIGPYPDKTEARKDLSAVKEKYSGAWVIEIK
jgi:cell division septation protein DedD